MSHADRVIDQFTRTAHGFATAPHILDREVLDRLLQAPGHRPDAAAAASALVQDSIANDMLGTDSRVESGEVVFSYPIAVMTARRPAAGGA